MRNQVYLLCGVSGSGKTWVCKQLADKYHYVPHDEHYEFHAKVVAQNARPNHIVITECPFGERPLREEMEYIYELDVTPFFVITPPNQVAKQYLEREGKYLSKAAYTRASTIINRAREWNAFHGTSQEVLNHLRNL